MKKHSGREKKRFNIKTWQLILVFIPLSFLALTLLRIDHIKMTELRSDVLAKDSSGTEEELSASLMALRSFVSSHIVINISEKNGNTDMFFGTGPFYLENTYKKAADKALKEAEKKLNDGETTRNIFAEASDTCKPQAIAGGWEWDSPEYIDCMMSEISKTPASADIVDTLKADIPSTELYRREYSSPIWTFSFSGVVIALCAIMLVVIFTRFIIWIIIRVSLLFM